jgi:hypothetical protein
MSSTSSTDTPTSATGVVAEPAPTPVRDWLTARPGRPVVVAGMSILLVQLVVRGWLGFRGYFYLDDFAFTGRAASSAVLDLHYLMLSYNNHLMPGSFAWVWVLTKIAPLNFGVVTSIDIVLQLVLGLVFFRLLRALFGTRPAILVPFVVGTLSAISLPAFLWWAAALNQLPEQIAMVSALLWHVRYLQTGRVRSGVLGAVAVLGGLLFSEKSLFIVPLVVAFTLLYETGGSPWRRIVTSWRRHRLVWGAYLVVLVPYTAYYVLAVPSPARAATDGAALGQLATQSYGHAVIPGLLGGPWTWTPIGAAGALAGPGDFARVLALVAFAAIVIATVAVRRRAALGWAVAFGYSVMNLGVLALSRATFVGPVIGDEYRYVTDLAIVAAIGGALSAFPLAGPWVRGGPLPVPTRDWVLRARTSTRARELWAVLPHPSEWVVAGVLVVSFAVSAGITSIGYDRYWRVNPARPYLTTLQAQIRAMPRGQVLADQRVPSGVAWALLGDYALESRIILSPVPHVAQRFLHAGQTAEDLHVVDGDGRIQRGVIDGVRAVPGPEGDCGWRLGSNPVDIALRPASLPGYWTVRIGYLASAATSASVTAGNTTLTVPFHRGLGSVWFLVTGTVATVDVSGLSTDATVCTNDVSVGTPVPVPATP